jgi:hypothetical protein
MPSEVGPRVENDERKWCHHAFIYMVSYKIMMEPVPPRHLRPSSCSLVFDRTRRRQKFYIGLI